MDSLLPVKEDGLNSVKSSVAKVLDKIKVLAYKSGLDVRTDLNALKNSIFKDIESQEHSHRLAPLYTLDPHKIEIGTINTMKQENGVDKHELFKSEYVKTMQALISMLNTLRKNYTWIDVKQIVEPMLKIEVKPKEPGALTPPSAK
jgi:hypothetical protein